MFTAKMPAHPSIASTGEGCGSKPPGSRATSANRNPIIAHNAAVDTFMAQCPANQWISRPTEHGFAWIGDNIADGA